jgi:TM2 domain-containing membrane protein YozV
MALNRKSPGVAILLSLLVTGAGHWYCGEVGRGMAFFGAAFLAGLLCLVLIGFILLPIVYVWAAIDANAVATRHNMALMTHAGGVA